MCIAKNMRRAFSLVELVLVMSIIAILAGFVSLGGVSSKTVDAFAEATRLEEALRSLRSAWLACYAETYAAEMRFPGDGYGEYTADEMPVKQLEAYMDRPLAGDIESFGSLCIAWTNAGHIYLGFAGSWRVDDTATKAAMKRHLAQSRTPCYEAVGTAYTANSGEKIMIRAR